MPPAVAAERHELERYERVHVQADILGGRVFAMTPRERPAANLASLVVDRSPIEGRAPALVSGLLPATTRAIQGPLVEDMAATPYPDLVVPGGRPRGWFRSASTPIAWRDATRTSCTCR